MSENNNDNYTNKINNEELEGLFLPQQESEEFCADRAMWRAVITQALMDAGSNSKKTEMKKEKARAISWLSGLSEDFAEVCIMAGYDKEYVKQKSKLAIKNGCKWRAESNPFKIKRDKKSRESLLERKHTGKKNVIEFKSLSA